MKPLLLFSYLVLFLGVNACVSVQMAAIDLLQIIGRYYLNRRIWLRAAPYLAILLSAGCGTTHEYPDSWASVQTATNGCPNISGTYADLATDAFDKKINCKTYYECWLSSKLHYRGRSWPWHEPEKFKVIIQQPSDNQITVKVVNSENCLFAEDLGNCEKVNEIDLRANKDFSCTDGAIKIGTGGIFGKGGYFFAKATDGTLVVQDEGWAYGREWFRWEKWDHALDRRQTVEEAAASGDYKSLFKGYRREQDKNVRKAWHYLCLAADRGHSGSRREIAWWHRTSNWWHSDTWGEAHNQALRNLGVGPNDRIAYMWLELAAAGGDTLALSVKETLAKKMSNEDIEKAKQMAYDWKPGQCPTKENPL